MYVDPGFTFHVLSGHRWFVMGIASALLLSLGCSGGESRRVAVVTSQGASEERDSLHEAARSYLADLQQGKAADVAQAWNITSLYEKSFGDDHRLATEEERTNQTKALADGLNQVFADSAFRSALEGLTIESLESDRQDDSTFWVALRLTREGSEPSELLFYAEQEGEQWRWLDLGRPGSLSSDELKTARSVDGRPIDEFLTTLPELSGTLARVIPVIVPPMVPPLPELNDLSFPEEETTTTYNPPGIVRQ